MPVEEGSHTGPVRVLLDFVDQVPMRLAGYVPVAACAFPSVANAREAVKAYALGTFIVEGCLNEKAGGVLMMM